MQTGSKKRQAVDRTTMQSKQPDRTFWGAYVLGHHVAWLRNYAWHIWSSRMDFLEGEREAPATAPAEADQMMTAMELLDDARCFEPGIAVRLTRAVEEWKRAFREMLRELSPRYIEPTRLEWESDSPPGDAEWTKLARLAGKVFQGDPQLEGWRTLGEMFEGFRVVVREMDSDAMASIRARVQELNPQNKLQFLGQIDEALGPSEEIAPPLLDDVLGTITIRSVEQYVRNCLWSGIQREILLKMDGDKVEFLGRELNGLSPSELGILRLLAERTLCEISREQLIEEARLSCGPEDVPPHITHLRKKLKEKIKLNVSADVRISADEAKRGFIYGTRDGTGKYQLEINRSQISLAGPRPTSMK